MDDENNIPAPVGNAQGGVVPQLLLSTEDIEVMASWTRNDLFKKKKFLFNRDEELKVGGRVFKMFVRDCKLKLEGLRKAGTVQRYRRMYL
jgi:hypothetical protein